MLSTKNIERLSAIGQIARHPYVILPPNDVDLYSSVQAASAFTSTTFAAIPGRTTIAGPGGWAANVSVQVLTGTNFTSAFTLEVAIDGLDECFRAKREVIVCTGDGAATQNFASKEIFSLITAITYRAAVGNIAGLVGPTFSTGIGDGAVAPTNFVIANPHPHLPLGTFAFLPQNSTVATTNQYVIAAELTLPDGFGGFRGLRLTTNVGTGATNRFAAVVHTTSLAAESIDT